MINELLTGRLWLRDTGNGKLFRRATLADVIRFRRIGGIPFDRGPRGIFAADGRWAAFEMTERVGFDLSPAGGWPSNTLAKLIGVIPNYAGEHMEMTRDFGTWHAGCGNGEGSVFADGEGRMRMGPNGTTLTSICTVHDFDGERDDHVRLIAAAPELLKALQHIDSNAAESVEWIRRVAREAISKATGRE